MKKMILFLFSVAFLTSCSLTEQYIADDVYVVKPSNLGVGESTADETTYAAFKQRKTGVSNDRQVFSDVDNFGLNGSRFSRFGNNYAWFLHTSQFPYDDRGGFYASGNPSWMGFNSWDTQIFMINNFGWNNGVWNGNSWGYDSWGHSQCFNCPFGAIGLDVWGNPIWMSSPMWGGYGYGGNFLTNDYALSAYHGPRGASSGFANPNGRRYNSVLKSGSTINGDLAQNGYGRTNRVQTGRVQNGRNSNLTVERKPIREIKNNQPSVRYNGTTGTSRSNGNSSSSRTYSRSDLGSRPVNSTYSSRNNANQLGRNGVSQGSRSSGSATTPSPGRSSSGGTSGSSSGASGSSRSGSTSGGGTSGRRQ